jgi:large subunit ribosomal protein L25
MNTTLEAEQRNPGKKGDARKLRRSGRVPAVYYGPAQEPMSLAVDPDVLIRLFQTTGDRNTVVQLKVDGTDYPALVREVQRHPVTREIQHIDFYCPPTDRAIEVMVPVMAVGKPAGAILGGRLRIIRREVRAACLYNKIPVNFEVDVSHMEVGDMVRASEVKTPSGVELVYDNDFNVVTVYGQRAEEEEEEESGEEGSDEEGSEGESSDGKSKESSE